MIQRRVIYLLRSFTGTIDHRFIDGFQLGQLAKIFRRVIETPWLIDGLEEPPQAVVDPAKLEAACREHGVTLHGTGIHPGGITERFPLMVSALSIYSMKNARRGGFSLERFDRHELFGNSRGVGEVCRAMLPDPETTDSGLNGFTRN